MKLKKLLFVTLGSLIVGLGISITIGVNLGSDPMTLFWIGIADQLHISRSYVSRIEKNALKKLKTLFG